MSGEQDKLKLSLEPPKLFGRKKKPRATGGAEQPPPLPASEESTASETPPEPAPEPETPPAPGPAPEKAPTGSTRTATRPTGRSVPAKPSRRPTKPALPVSPEPVTDAEIEDAEIASATTDEPLLTVYKAAAVTGLVVGAAMVALTWLALRGCEAVRGTASCGSGPGFLLLVATFVVCVLLGSTLLKTFMIPDPGSSSFLAVGLVSVVALLILIDVLGHWAMLIVIPVISIGAFLASAWVTKTFVDPAET